MSAIFLNEVPRQTFNDKEARRYFLFQVDDATFHASGELLAHAALPARNSAFPGLNQYRCTGYEIIQHDPARPQLWTVTALYTRNNALSAAQTTPSEPYPWLEPWQCSIHSVPVVTTQDVRYNVATNAVESNLNSAGELFEDPITVTVYNDLIHLQRAFESMPPSSLFEARGRVNDGALTVCSRSGACGQFYLRDVALEKKYYTPILSDAVAVAYYDLKLEIEFCDREVSGHDGTRSGFYLTLPSYGANERKNLNGASLLVPIRFPRVAPDGTVSSDVFDRFRRWPLKLSGEAYSQAEAAQGSLFVMGPYLNAAPTSWSFVQTLGIPSSL